MAESAWSLELRKSSTEGVYMDLETEVSNRSSLCSRRGMDVWNRRRHHAVGRLSFQNPRFTLESYTHPCNREVPLPCLPGPSDEVPSCVLGPDQYPEGPSTQYLRFLVPKSIQGMVLGTRSLKYFGTWTLWVGHSSCTRQSPRSSCGTGGRHVSASPWRQPVVLLRGAVRDTGRSMGLTIVGAQKTA